VLSRSEAALKTVLMALDQNKSGDILAFELRNAMAELGKITGEIDTDAVLGEIFGKFCIGK
jgi:tRNA modification GTPase